MLAELHVRDLALIEDVWIEFGSGMTVLTGETGAGKTALLGALKLLIGERADSTAVRAGASEALVEGRFARPVGEMIVKRRAGADGRSRASIDDEMATIGALANVVGPLVDLHGQHEHQALLASATHVGYLDRWAGDAAVESRARYRDALAAHAEALAARDRLRALVADATQRADYLRFVSEEIGRVSPTPDEDAELEARLPALQHGERLAEAASEASALLRGDGGALDRIAMAASALGRVEGIDPALDLLAERLGEAAALVDDTGGELRAYRDRVEHDPAALDALLGRLGQLNALMKKYGPRLADVLDAWRDADEALSSVVDSEAGMAAAELAVESAREVLLSAADELAAIRQNAAPGFVAALGDATADLAMGGASFEVAFTPLEFERWTADGSHRIEFLYAPAPGQPARPLARIASGGELSRVMLALKSVLGSADEVETLVFDEVDAGIGGATAIAVGRRLAELARTHQLIVVTHLAQVAAFADTHLVVSKSVDADGAATSVRATAGEERIVEIARMLSGAASVSAITHARELLEQCAAEV